MNDWFRELGLGLFIHWGHASTRGWELSWQMTGGVRDQSPPRSPVPIEDYFANAAGFDPERFDPAGWADLAWRAGARYVVFTAKHHDGFAMFDTKLSDYKAGRDYTREIVDSFRNKGFRIGLYFSIIDWHHEDYPRYTDATVRKPYVVGDYPRGTREQWERYRAFMLGQLGELLTGYGPIDILWLDGEFEHTAEEWDFAAIREFVRERQPYCLVNDRCVGHGDFVTPEQQLPLAPPDRLWETCLTMNESWGYVTDEEWKDAGELLRTLVEAVAMGGNLLLNVGPTGTGEFPAEATARLEAFATWMERHEESIRGVRTGLELWQFHGPSTRRSLSEGGERLYLHLVMRPYERLTVRGLPIRRITDVRLLGVDGRLAWSVLPWLKEVHSGTGDPLGDLRVEIPSALLDPMCSVVVVDLS
ncbi:alpha-L-fucosidase [Microtetraspora malaysiensis]|uniref:alpha-L-fucosidase n=1 Tax=Microtetraspora malaysiensis TaxID=161358 RepID=UPI003D92AC0B